MAGAGTAFNIQDESCVHRRGGEDLGAGAPCLVTLPCSLFPTREAQPATRFKPSPRVVGAADPLRPQPPTHHIVLPQLRGVEQVHANCVAQIGHSVRVREVHLQVMHRPVEPGRACTPGGRHAISWRGLPTAVRPPEARTALRRLSRCMAHHRLREISNPYQAPMPVHNVVLRRVGALHAMAGPLRAGAVPDA